MKRTSLSTQTNKSRLSQWEEEHEVLLSTFLSQATEETQTSNSVKPAQPNREVSLTEQTETKHN
jgi:hypothetical protein